MRLIKIILLFILVPCLCFSKTLWNEDNSIYSTKQKYKKGDTLKIIFNEKTLVNYQTSLSEESKKSSAIKGGKGQMINFLPDLGSGDSFQTSEKSSVKNKGSLEKNITAEIIKIDNNGNLEIFGTHSIRVNDTLEQVSVRGTVNPKVIKNKKSVYSTDIINPSISYKSRINKPDIITSKDYIQTSTTNISSTAGANISPQGKTNLSTQYQTNITSQYQISDKKKNELIIKYLNKVLSILFTK